MAKRRERAREKEKTCLLVLGMHRSGTSALAGVLARLGCDLPANLMQASQRNEKGFFESVSIRDLNQEILASAGTSWDSYEAVNEGWMTSPVARRFRQRALEVLQEEFSDSPFFVLKDPRICRLLPFWLDVLDAFGCAVKPVLTVRQPMEVAASLKARKNCDEARGQLLWLRHVLEAERRTRGMARFHTSYDSLFESWGGVVNRMQDTLGFSWPRAIEQAAGETSRFLTPILRHHAVAPARLFEDPLVNDWVRSAYDVFFNWAENGENPEDHARLDQVFAEFDAAARGFRGVLEEEHRRSAELASEKEALDQTNQEVLDKSRLLRKKFNQAELASTEANAALQELRLETERRVGQLNTQLQQSRDTLQGVREEADRNAERIRVADTEVAELRDRLQHTESALRQRQHEVDDTLAQLTDLKAGQEAQEQKNKGLQRRLAVAQSEQKAQADDLARLQKSSDTEIAGLQEAVSERFRELAVLTRLLQEGQAATARDQEELKVVKDKLSHERERRAALRTEVDDLLQERDHLRHEVGMLHDSTSWKITAPLRRVVRLLRGQ